LVSLNVADISFKQTNSVRYRLPALKVHQEQGFSTGALAPLRTTSRGLS